MKPLSFYRGQLVDLRHKRQEIDTDVAQVLAEAVLDGHNIHDLLHSGPDRDQVSFDL